MIIEIDLAYFQICPVDISLMLITLRKVVQTKVIIDVSISLFPQSFDNNSLTNILVSFPLNLLINTKHLLILFLMLLLQNEFLKLASPRLLFFFVTGLDILWFNLEIRIVWLLKSSEPPTHVLQGVFGFLLVESQKHLVWPENFNRQHDWSTFLCLEHTSF